MTLRWYQKQAVEAVWDYLRNKDGAPCVVLPTGSGKTFVISELARQVVAWGGRALVLSHVKELLAQTSEKLRAVVDNASSVGVYSAGLNERTADTPIVVAGIQSVYDRVAELGEFHLIVVDEAHLIPPSGTGRYRRLLEEEKTISPKARLVGLTATPYRLGSGWIVRDKVKEDDDRYDRLLDSIVYEAPIAALIADGTLSKVVGIQAQASPDFSRVHTVRGDFDESEVEKILAGKNVLASACQEIVKHTKDRNKVVVFCNRRESARKCAQLLTTFQTEFDAVVIDGDTPSGDRDELVRRFKGQGPEKNLLGESVKPLKYVCNVGVLTTGFDAPCVDCVALLRPTKSLALYQQMVGRGLRTADNKKDCLVLDFGGNVDRHGPIDLANPETTGSKRWRTCPDCGTVLKLGVFQCPTCGYEFPRSKPTSGPRDANKNIDGKASGRALLSDDEPPTVEEFEVKSVTYKEHRRKDATPDDPSTLQVEYKVEGSYRPIFEWLCPEHEGWARKRFERWWKDKSATPPPAMAEDAAKLATDGALATPTRIKTTRKSGDLFPRVEWLEQSEIPAPATIKDSNETFFDEFSAFEERAEEEEDWEKKSGYSYPQQLEKKELVRCMQCGRWNDYGLENFDGKCREKVEPRNGREIACSSFVERFVDKECPF